MTWYEFLLFVHVACAAIWIGGAFIFQIYGPRRRARGRSAEMAQFAGRAGFVAQRVFPPAAVIVLPRGDRPDGGRQLVVGPALGAVRAGGLRGLVPARLLRHRPARGVPAVRRTDDSGRTGRIRRVFGLLRVDLLFLFAIVFAMTVKPTGDDGWTIVIAAAVLVALAALFLRQALACARRRGSADADG